MKSKGDNKRLTLRITNEKSLLFFNIPPALLTSCSRKAASQQSEINAADYGLAEVKDGKQAMIRALEEANIKICI